MTFSFNTTTFVYIHVYLYGSATLQTKVIVVVSSNLIPQTLNLLLGKTGAEIKPGDSSDETDMLSNKGLIAGNCFLCRPILKPLFTCLYSSSYLVIHPV